MVLANAPLKLRIKVGDKNVPINKLLASTRSKLTHAAIRQPNKMSTATVITFANPGFTPGKGLGSALSAI